MSGEESRTKHSSKGWASLNPAVRGTGWEKYWWDIEQAERKELNA